MHRFQPSMEKDGDASIAVIRRHQSGLFGLLRGDAKCRKGEGSWFGPIVSRWIFERPIASAKKNGKIAGLKIHNSYVDTTVAVKVSSEPKIRSGVGARIASRLERSIPDAEKSCEAVLLAVDHK